MKQKNILKSIVVVILSISLLLAKPYIEAEWTRFMGFVGPHGEYDDYLMKKWSNKPSNYLIGKLDHPSVAYSGVAMSLLSKRIGSAYESEKVLKIIKMNTNKRAAAFALSVYFIWNESDAINLSMDIIKSGKDNKLFYSALHHLTKRKYEPAYPYVLELINAPDKYNNGSAAYLADYGKLESISILEDMLKNTTDSLYQTIIKTAITSIKEQNGIKT